MTMGYDPNPIYTGVMLNTMCLTKVTVAPSKVFYKVYSVKSSGYIGKPTLLFSHPIVYETVLSDY